MNLSAFSAAPCSLKFSDMATPLVDGCRDAFIVSPNGVASYCRNVRCGHDAHSVFLPKKSLPNASEFFGCVRKGVAHAG